MGKYRFDRKDVIQGTIEIEANCENNAEEIFSLNDVDGGLIGGASLNFSDFNAIVQAANG